MNGQPSHLFMTGARLSALLLAFVAATALMPSATINAQDLDDVTITGRIADQNGAIIPNASVTAVLVKTNVERTVEANDEGRYRIIELEPGEYIVRVTSAGFATEEKTNLVTVAGQNVQLDFALRPADVTAEQVVVSEAETPAVDTTRTVVGGTVTTEEVEALPNFSRSPLDLIFTLGGVTEEPLSTRDLAEDRNTNPSNTLKRPENCLRAAGLFQQNHDCRPDINDDRAARSVSSRIWKRRRSARYYETVFAESGGRAAEHHIRTPRRIESLARRVFRLPQRHFSQTRRATSLGLPSLPLEDTSGIHLSGPVRCILRRSSDILFYGLEYDPIFARRR